VFDLVWSMTAAIIATVITLLVLTGLWVVLPVVGGEHDKDHVEV